jgi:uroporphyrinogen-III synthase
MARVLVTRPEPQAAATARRLDELGYEPVILPLTQTVALPVDVASLPDRIDAVAVTSANALLSAPAALLARLADAPCFAVGETTARQALSPGLSQGQETGSAGSETLGFSGVE